MSIIRNMKAGLVALALIACAQEQPPVNDQTSNDQPALAPGEFPPGPYADRDPALAKQLVDAGALLLDVRSPSEFADGHVEGAINIAHTEVPAQVAAIRERQGGDLDKPIVVYCRSGRRSGIAKGELKKAGFTRVTNLGGLSDWPQ